MTHLDKQNGCSHSRRLCSFGAVRLGPHTSAVSDIGCNP